jgi:asparagine synthase (glutamine-hydrolysing)
MCGFAGVIDFSASVEPDEVARMSELIAHRGPDDSGLYSEPGVVLAARRLAIIDLSPAGRQPFSDESGRYHLVFNGELYNYRELRAELEQKGRRFRSETDTEVLLSSYLEWGEHCTERFNGMWAFVIWDSAERRAFCSRDRFGEKPFYYRRTNGRLTLASELKAFRADGRSLRANNRVVRDYLAHGLIDHGAETFFAGILQLPPAHSMTFSNGGLEIKPYWRLEPHDPPEEPTARLRELLLDSIRLRLRSDVPVGTCLSGGIDSSAIVTGAGHLLRRDAESAAALGGRIKTFTAFFEDREIDERPYAEAVVRQVGADGHFVSFSGRELVEALPSIVEAQDEPFRSTSIAAQWYVMREARSKGLKVMLDGQGGDELFAGYHGYLGFFFANLLLQGRLRELAAEVRAQRRSQAAGAGRLVAALARPFVPASVAWRARAAANGSAALLGPAVRGAAFSAPRSSSEFPDRFRRQLHLVLTTRLPELLHYEDRNSMTHSLEARVPFLDHRLAELAFSLAAHDLIRGGKSKFVLREALNGLLPETVRSRTTKLGFETPEGRWLRGSLGLMAADVFHSRSFSERGFVDARAAQRRLDRHRRGTLAAGFELWRALNLELWARTFLDR